MVVPERQCASSSADYTRQPRTEEEDISAYALRIDFGAAGQRSSAAQLVRTYPDPTVLVGRLVVAVVDFSKRRVAGFGSEVLVPGALAPDGNIPLLGVDAGRAGSAGGIGLVVVRRGSAGSRPVRTANTVVLSTRPLLPGCRPGHAQPPARTRSGEPVDTPRGYTGSVLHSPETRC